MNIGTLTLSRCVYLQVQQQIQRNLLLKAKTSNIVRLYSQLTTGEQNLEKIIKMKFPQASSVKVADISGGCGAMYEVHIEAPDFQGKKLVEQHLMVSKALKEEIADMHGIRITTKSTQSSTGTS